MKDKNGKTVLAKFARPIEYKAAFPRSPRGAWQKDCDAVNRVAEELRKRMANQEMITKSLPYRLHLREEVPRVFGRSNDFRFSRSSGGVRGDNSGDAEIQLHGSGAGGSSTGGADGRNIAPEKTGRRFILRSAGSGKMVHEETGKNSIPGRGENR